MVIVDASLSLPRIGAGYHLRYTVDGKGRIQVEATYQPEKEDIPLMPKFGMRMRMPSALNRIAWYGLHRTARQCQPVRYTLVHAGRQ